MLPRHPGELIHLSIFIIGTSSFDSSQSNLWRLELFKVSCFIRTSYSLSVRDYLIFSIRINCRSSSSMETVPPLCSITRGGHRTHLPRKTACLHSRKKILIEGKKNPNAWKSWTSPKKVYVGKWAYEWWSTSLTSKVIQIKDMITFLYILTIIAKKKQW